MLTESEKQMLHAIETILPKPKTGPGALDGFTATCTCGYERSNSLSPAMAAFDLEQHCRFMNARVRAESKRK